MVQLGKPLAVIIGNDSTWELNPGGKFVKGRVVPQCTRPWISLLASHGEVSDKPVILTGQISAEKALHSVGLSLLDRTELPPDKQKCSAPFDSPRPFCVSWPQGRPDHTAVPILPVFYTEMARLTCSLLLMQGECCSTFTLLIVSYSYENRVLWSSYNYTSVCMGRRGGLYHIFSASLFQVTYFLCAQNTLFSANTLFLLVHTQGNTCLTGKQMSKLCLNICNLLNISGSSSN